MNMNGILIGSEDPKRLSEFYAKLFGAPQWSDGAYDTWLLGTGWMSVGAHDQVHGRNGHPGRLIWNLESADVPGDFERLKGAGATVVAEPYHPGEENEAWIATFADPDDNYFQLISPMGPDES